MARPLKTLVEHNEERMKVYQDAAVPNGIECPRCKSEMFDTDGRNVGSGPPQTRIHCKKCGYQGTRVI